MDESILNRTFCGHCSGHGRNEDTSVCSVCEGSGEGSMPAITILLAHVPESVIETALALARRSARQALLTQIRSLE